MATSKQFLNYVIDQLSPTGNVAFKPMMGEYLFYYEGVHVGGLYDDRVLIKRLAANDGFGLESERPYEGAKRFMRKIDDLDDVEFLRKVLTATAEQLKSEQLKSERLKKR